MQGKKLLMEFIRMSFGLDRYVTMNALSDVVGGPEPMSSAPSFPTTSYESFRSNPGDPQVNVTDRLMANIVDEDDVLDDEPVDNEP